VKKLDETLNGTVKSIEKEKIEIKKKKRKEKLGGPENKIPASTVQSIYGLIEPSALCHRWI
jgi:hypothetical protein